MSCRLRTTMHPQPDCAVGDRTTDAAARASHEPASARSVGPDRSVVQPGPPRAEPAEGGSVADEEPESFRDPRHETATSSGAPGPTGSPRASHSVSMIIQPIMKAKVYGSMVAMTVPMPACLSYRSKKATMSAK